MKNLPLKNPFFYATLVLAGLLVFELSGIVAAQYAAPTTAPVGGTPAAPLHAGSATQTKTGILNVKGTGSGVSLNPNGLFYFLNSAGSPVAGFRYNGTSVQYSNNASTWQDIGTGTGGGDSQWTQSGSSIYYARGNVGVGLTNPAARLEVRGGIAVSAPETTTRKAYVQKGSSSGHTGTRMTCDTSDISVDCDSIVSTNDAVGTTKYDYYSMEECGKIDEGTDRCLTSLVTVSYRYAYTVENTQVPTGNNTTVFRVAADGRVQMAGWSGGAWVLDKWVADGTQISCTASWGGGNDSTHAVRVNNGQVEVRVSGGGCTTGWVRGRSAQCDYARGDDVRHYLVSYAPGFSGAARTSSVLGGVAYGPALGGIQDLVGIQSADGLQACAANF